MDSVYRGDQDVPNAFEFDSIFGLVTELFNVLKPL